MEKTLKRFTFTPGAFSWFAVVAIVIARAFQPNAEPMCDWSFWSWILMTLPVTWPVVLIGGLFVIGGIFNLIYNFFCRPGW